MKYRIIFMLSWKREKGREKWSGLQIYIMHSAGYNTDYNKFGEKMRVERLESIINGIQQTII